MTNISGVSTSENNYLDAYYEVLVNRKAFPTWETKEKKEYKALPAIENIKNNAIAFFLTQDKKLGYQFVDSNGQVVVNICSNTNYRNWLYTHSNFIYSK